MPAAPVDLYVAAFLARCDTPQAAGRPRVDAPGVRGLLGSIEDPRVRLLVTDDRARDALALLLRDARLGMISIFGEAGRCAQLVADRLGWSSDAVTAMVCRNLDGVPAPSLPSELTLRPVRRGVADEPGAVALDDAVAAAKAAAPAIDVTLAVFADYLRSLPANFRLFAAVDGHGTVRATSGCGVFGEYATVIFVNTDSGWRGRGVGQAMTSQALRAAQRSGARRACLDASAAGQSIYRRLGFEAAGPLTRFQSPG